MDDLAFEYMCMCMCRVHAHARAWGQGPGPKARGVAACMRVHARVGMHPEIQPRNINQATIVIILIIIKPIPASQLHGVHVLDGGAN